MAFKPFKKIRLIDDADLTPKNINLLQDNVAEAVSQVLGKDALDTTMVTNVSLVAGSVNKIAHNLGRKLNGYLVVRCHGGFPMIYDVQDTNPSPHLLLYLMSATNITVDLLVF